MYPLKLWKFLKFGQKSTFFKRLYLKTNKSHRIKYKKEFVAPSLLYAPTKNKECYSCIFVLTFFDRKVGFLFFFLICFRYLFSFGLITFFLKLWEQMSIASFCCQ